MIARKRGWSFVIRLASWSVLCITTLLSRYHVFRCWFGQTCLNWRFACPSELPGSKGLAEEMRLIGRDVMFNDTFWTKLIVCEKTIGERRSSSSSFGRKKFIFLLFLSQHSLACNLKKSRQHSSSVVVACEFFGQRSLKRSA